MSGKVEAVRKSECYVRFRNIRIEADCLTNDCYLLPIRRDVGLKVASQRPQLSFAQPQSRAGDRLRKILPDRVETPVAAQPAAISIRLDVLSEPGNSVCEDRSNA